MTQSIYPGSVLMGNPDYERYLRQRALNQQQSAILGAIGQGLQSAMQNPMNYQQAEQVSNDETLLLLEDLS